MGFSVEKAWLKEMLKLLTWLHYLWTNPLNKQGDKCGVNVPMSMTFTPAITLQFSQG